MSNLKPPSVYLRKGLFALVDRFYQIIRGEQIAASYRLVVLEGTFPQATSSFDSPTSESASRIMVDNIRVGFATVILSHDYQDISILHG
jgi:hypothetical protein